MIVGVAAASSWAPACLIHRVLWNALGSFIYFFFLFSFFEYGWLYKDNAAAFYRQTGNMRDKRVPHRVKASSECKVTDPLISNWMTQVTHCFCFIFNRNNEKWASHLKKSTAWVVPHKQNYSISFCFNYFIIWTDIVFGTVFIYSDTHSYAGGASAYLAGYLLVIRSINHSHMHKDGATSTV